MFGSILAFLGGVWMINLYNFMDGIDGLAAAQAIYMLGFACLAGVAFQGDAAFAQVGPWMLAVAGASAGFLWHNWAPARIFMGDIGSTFLAFTILALACLTLRAGWLSLPFWLILGALFISDATVTLLRRMTTGQAWLEAHRSHAYQRLSRRWGSHGRTSMLAIAINLAWLAPLAWLAMARPQWAPALVVLAYLPLVAATLVLKAGRPDA